MDPIPDRYPRGPDSKTFRDRSVLSGPAVDKTSSERICQAHLNKQFYDILARISGAEPSLIKPEARLIEDIGIDSLGFYEILIEADEHLGIKIREEDLLNFRTVEDIQTYLSTLYPDDAQAN
ncbi:MAG: acyl carrier protein [Cyanobacteria bacterium K_DeepCast_35m_m2_023]|nr:acyl carrier protein [Cyanobacteria bacterium K_DeepCast_35m_m2_023]